MDQRDNEPEEDSRSAEKELVDATIKLVRLMANLSIDPSIGEVLGSKNPNALEVKFKYPLKTSNFSQSLTEVCYFSHCIFVFCTIYYSIFCRCSLKCSYP